MKKAVLVVDYIRAIAEGKGSCSAYLKAHPEVVDNTNNLIKAARENGDLVVHIRLAFDKEYRGLPAYAPSAAVMKANQKYQQGSADVEFIDEIDVDQAKGDVVLDKKYGDPFYGSGLLDLLQKNGVETVVLSGISTDNAILNGANTAMESNFYVVVAQDACGASTQEKHEQALVIMKGRSVNKVVNTADFLPKLIA
jgi:nicotinamidase-related amidase